MAQLRFCVSKFSVALSLKLALLVSCFLLAQIPQALLAQGIPQRWDAKKYKPRSGIGAPSRVEGGGTRSSNNNCPVEGKPLTALLPTNGFGVTASAYPSFFVYTPAVSPQALPLSVEFILEDTSGKTVYKSIFQTDGQPGILKLTLPREAGLLPLTVGQDYKWSFSIICRPDERSQDIFVQGWVRRVDLDETLNNQLTQASPQKQVELYAGAEIWQDALTTLVQLRRDNPNDAAIVANWENLLKAAGLNDIAQEPLVSTLTTP